jgi:hypothetical protein
VKFVILFVSCWVARAEPANIREVASTMNRNKGFPLSSK